MGIVFGMARFVANEIKRSNPEETISIDRMAAVLANKFNTWLIILLTVALSLALHQFIGSTVAMIAFVILRLHTGGRHMPNLDLCVLFSVSLFLFIPFISLPYVWIMGINIITCLILLMNASISRTRTPRPLYIRRQFLSLSLGFSGFIPGFDIIALVCFVQALLLLGKEVKRS